MTVDAGKSCRVNQVWVSSASGMSVHLSSIGFRDEAQICHINLILMLFHTHQEILRLDVSMNDILEMNVLKTANELIDKHQHRFEKELATAEVEEIFQAWSQQIKHQGVKAALCLINVNSWNIDIIRKKSIDLDFKFEKEEINKDVFEFDDDLFVSINADFWKVMSLMNLLQSLCMLIIYVHSVEVFLIDSSLKLIFIYYA